MKKIFRYIAFYLVECTWGILSTLVGAVCALAMLITGHKPKMVGPFVQFVSRNEGGWGFSGGLFIFTSKDCEFHYPTLAHEMGHGSLQLWLLGPLQLFLVSIPSVIRFWYREWLVNSGRKRWSELPLYDSVWFEGTATKWGTIYAKRLKKFGYLGEDFVID